MFMLLVTLVVILSMLTRSVSLEEQMYFQGVDLFKKRGLIACLIAIASHG